MPKRIHYSQGFTYPMMLVFVGMASITSLVTYQQTSTFIMREREIELLFIGEQYLRALESYYNTNNRRQLPSRIEDLIQDNRYLAKKHLRRIYLDPMIASTSSDLDLEVIRDRNGLIVGVASRSTLKPFKRENFPPKYEHFRHADTYNEWKFIFNPSQQGNEKAKND